MAKDGAAGGAPLRVLFLQGPPSGFWVELGDAFAAAGHVALRVHLSTADRLFWRRPGGVSYRGTFAGWRGWIGAFLERERVDAVLGYADRLPYHVVAAEEAEARGVPFLVVENGYLRPDWLTLERGGMGAFSRLPADPEAIRRLAEGLPEAPSGSTGWGHPFWREAAGEVAFGLINALFAWPYPFFRMDRPWTPLLDYPAWLPRLARARAAARAAEAVVRAATGGAWPFHLFALQLQADYQIRDNSPYADLGEALAETVESFARHARPDRRLIVKVHPLDNGLEGWARIAARAAARHGAGDRVIVIDGGRLDLLLGRADGVVAVNSTVGLHAILARRPVIALGAAVWDVPGLAHQGPLSAFWEAPEAVDAALARDFAAVLAAHVQLRGSFYHPEGRRAAQAEIVRRVAGALVNPPGWRDGPPPRLPLARRPTKGDRVRAAAARGEVGAAPPQ